MSSAIPCARSSSSSAKSAAFSVSRSSSGLNRRSTVKLQASGTTLKFVPPSTRPPSIRIEWAAASGTIR